MPRTGYRYWHRAARLRWDAFWSVPRSIRAIFEDVGEQGDQAGLPLVGRSNFGTAVVPKPKRRRVRMSSVKGRKLRRYDKKTLEAAVSAVLDQGRDPDEVADKFKIVRRTLASHLTAGRRSRGMEPASTPAKQPAATVEAPMETAKVIPLPAPSVLQLVPQPKTPWEMLLENVRRIDIDTWLDQPENIREAIVTLRDHSRRLEGTLFVDGQGVA